MLNPGGILSVLLPSPLQISALSTMPATWYVVHSHFWNEWINKNSLRGPAKLFNLKEHSTTLPFWVQLPFHWMSRDEDWHHLGTSQFVTAVEHEGKDVVILTNPNCSLFLQAETRTFLQIKQTLLSSLHVWKCMESNLIIVLNRVRKEWFRKFSQNMYPVFKWNLSWEPPTEWTDSYFASTALC